MEQKKSVLDRIKEFADKAHGDQMRKYTGQRYIVHPVEVMQICSKVTSDLSVLSAALLHDLLEDTPVTKEEIKTFLQTLMDLESLDRTLNMVIDLTDVYIKDAFPMLNRRARKDKEHQRLSTVSPDSQTIKYADIISNSIDISAHDSDFGPVYLREMKALLKSMDKGNQQLYQKATETVEMCLKQLNKEFR